MLDYVQPILDADYLPFYQSGPLAPAWAASPSVSDRLRTPRHQAAGADYVTVAQTPISSAPGRDRLPGGDPPTSQVHIMRGTSESP